MRVARLLAVTISSLALAGVVSCQSVLGDFTLEGTSADGGVDSSLANTEDASGTVGNDGSGPSDGNGTDGSSTDGSGSDGSSTDGGPGPSDAGPDGNFVGTCNAASCPFGCCAPGGVCVPYANQLTNACGAAGAVCASCPGLEVCDTTTGVCGCNAVSCATGCCDSSHGCHATGDSTCGTGGGSCSDCTTNGQECVGGSCQCDAHSCPNGCCPTGGGACQTNGVSTCGVNGATCRTCTTGQACSLGGSCICAPGCAGCCAGGANGACVGGTENPTCGVNGQTCANCTLGQGQECAETDAGAYVCMCDAHSCPDGCCDVNGSCQPNVAPNCGIKGVACMTTCSAASGQECNSTGACVCDSTSCSTGCCTSATGTCVSPRSSTQCAPAGAVCIACANSTFTCSATGACACPTGDIDCGGSCINPLTNGTYCGASGTTCTGGTTCSGGKTCQNGACACPSGGTVCGTQCTTLLTDPANCGTCGHSCGPTATCSAGQCQPVAVCTYSADTTGSVFDLTVNSAGIAGFTWEIGGSSGAIVSCDTSALGKTVNALYTLSIAPTGISSDAQSFYWTNENAGSVVSGPIAGGASNTLVAGLSNPVGIAAVTGATFAGTTPAFFYATGGDVDLYVSGASSVCISGIGFPYLLGTNFVGGGTTIATTWVAVSDVFSNAVYLAPSTNCGGGKAAVTIATGVPGADTATTDGTNVFFGTRGNSTTPAALYACPIAGCSPVANPTPYVPNQGSVGRVVLDGNNVIWTADATGGGLLECPKTGGCTTPTVVVPNAFTNALAARNGFIYYVSGGTLYVVAE